MIRYSRILVGLVLSSTLTYSMHAGTTTLNAVGVVGNTGEEGASLIQQTDDHYRGHGNVLGCGVVLDKQGTLWTRMIDDKITRLTLDGRQLAQFPSPPSTYKHDVLVAMDDRIILLANEELLSLPLNAKPGTPFKKVGLKLRCIGRTPYKGRLAAITPESQVVWVNPADGTTEKVIEIPNAWMIEANAKGELFVGNLPEGAREASMHKIVNGHEVTSGGWPRSFGTKYVSNSSSHVYTSLQSDGEGGFFLGGGFCSHLDGNLDPDPGTVLGMQGETVIGRGGDWHHKLNSVRSVVRYGKGLYVIGGGWGNPFFVSWPNPQAPMKLVSWAVALPDCRTLALDTNGDIYTGRERYEWTSPPDSFPATNDGASTRKNLLRLMPGMMVSQDTWAHGNSWALPFYRLTDPPGPGAKDWLGGGKLNNDQWWTRANKDKKAMPAVSYSDGKDGFIFLSLVDPKGGLAMRIYKNGRFREDFGPVTFTLKESGKELTSLSMKNDNTMLAAVDGQVVELVKDGKDWKETKRWNKWGTKNDQQFGKSIYLAFDAGHLIVSDSDRHRVLVFGAKGGIPLAQLGKTDTPAKALDSFTKPGLIAICGNRAVVHDSENQRIVKMELSK